LKFELEGSYHSSEGLGEGLLSLFFIVDALYDAPEQGIVVVDEPELSLHPFLQRKLRRLFADWSKSHQLIVATHSPYFVDFTDVVAGAKVARVHLQDFESKISQLSDDAVERVEGFLRDRDNPHILGLDAREVFFLWDGVILVEGQDDVICYPRVASQLDEQFAGQFFGWGVGGAGNMRIIAKLLKDLGFQKVVGLLDKNKEEEADRLRELFPNYRFFVIPADDVRTKPERPPKSAVTGLLDERGLLRPDLADEVPRVIQEVNTALG
jgi:hypothetical protein